MREAIGGEKKRTKQRKQTREKEMKITWTTFWPLVPSYCLDVWMWRNALHSFKRLVHQCHYKMSVSYSPSSSHLQFFDVFGIKFSGIKQTCTLIKLCDIVCHMVLFVCIVFWKTNMRWFWVSGMHCVFILPLIKEIKKKKKTHTVTSPGLRWRSMFFYRPFKRNYHAKGRCTLFFP